MAKSATVQTITENGISGKIMSWPQRIKVFYNDVRNEMKKVTTPSWKEVQVTTVVVIICVALFGIYFWILDDIFLRTVDKVFHFFR